MPIFARYPAAQYIAPFGIFLLFLALAPQRYFSASVEAPLWFLVMAVVCYICWPRELSLRPIQPTISLIIGVLVFALWIGPDLIIPGYRNHPLFSNSIMGHLHSSIQPADLKSSWVLSWRTARAVLIVPIVEELFWRAWLMRWLIRPEFKTVALGTYSAFSFWLTAALFGSEHGPYWDVGLLTGIVYNFWMIRTKSIADCILMHAVTNLALSLYVIYTSQWQYWQ